MNTNYSRSTDCNFAKKGFALIVCVSLLALLSVIVLAYLSLSVSTTRLMSSSNHQAIAQANARMALLIAVGDLQRSLGSDQRVSATASIFDADVETLEIDGVELPETLGAWSTVQEDGQPIIYQSSEGWHADHRNPDDSEYVNHRENVFSWLISGSENPNFDPRMNAFVAGSDAVALGKSEGHQILAPLVRSLPDHELNASYAYHVTDLGMSAPMVQHNKEVSKEPSMMTPADGGYDNFYNGSKRHYGEFSESAAFKELAEDELVSNEELSSRYISDNTLMFDLAGEVDSGRRDTLLENDQRFTTTNKALLVDTLRGGWRVDLTPYMKQTEQPGEASLSGQSGELLNDTTPMLSHERFQAFSPKFGALRDYVKLGDMAGTDRELEPRAPVFGGGRLQDYPDPQKVWKHGVHPFIVEYSYYARPVMDEGSPDKVSLLIYPRVTLWNPYNVKIVSSEYFFQINQRSYMKIWVNEAGTDDKDQIEYQYADSYWGLAPLSGDGARARNAYLFFYLESVSLEPGQSLVFSPAHDGVQKLEYRNGNISANVLSASADVNDLNCFYVQMKKVGATPIDVNKSYEYKFRRYWDNGYHIGYEDSTSARLRLANSRANYQSVISGSDESPDFPVVHTMDTNNWFRANEGRWSDINRPWLPLFDVGVTVPPDNRTKIGMRLKTYYETTENMVNQPNGFWHYPLFELSNMRAPFYRRAAWDWLASLPTIIQGYTFGPLAEDSQEQSGYLDGFMLPRYVNGLAESSPFLNNGAIDNLRFAPFSIPPAGVDVFSMGQLRQVPLTHEFGSPSFIIGESLTSVAAPRDQSAFSFDDYSEGWKNSFGQGYSNNRIQSYAPWWQAEYDPNNNSYASFDYRYETNLALWDHYFFSTKPSDVALSELQEPGSLPNQNLMVVNESGSNLQDPSASKADVIARHLRLKNHHSVNSTNLLAWKSLLAMNMGMGIDGKSTDEKSTPFPGTSSPLSDGVNSVSSVDSETWTGYRQLSLEEIETLSEEIVAQVKQRAPFISLSDFVNRRLYDAGIVPSAAPDTDSQSEEDLLSYAGPLEIAIHKAALNAGMQDYKVKKSSDYAYAQDGKYEARFATANAPVEVYTNAPAHLTQGKILETIGASLTPRSDTFRVRAYGEARDADGNVIARAWCEARVQRSSEYVDADSDDSTVAFDDLISETNKKFGRRFYIESFRWLSEAEANTQL